MSPIALRRSPSLTIRRPAAHTCPRNAPRIRFPEAKAEERAEEQRANSGAEVRRGLIRVCF